MSDTNSPANETPTAAEEKKAKLAVVPAEFDGKPVIVERNGIKKQLSAYKIIRGKRENTVYFAPKLDASSPEAIQADLTWFGWADVVAALQVGAKKAFQDVFFGCFNEAGEFNLAQFIQEATDFTSAGLKMKELKDMIEENQSTLSERVAGAKAEDWGNVEWQQENKRLADLINGLKAKAEARSKKKDEADEAEPSVEVK